MDLRNYFRRLTKYLLFLIVILGIILIPASLKRELQFSELIEFIFQNQRLKILLIATFTYSFIYPVLAFGKKSRFYGNQLKTDKERFCNIFEGLGYILTEETENRLVFRKKSGLARLLVMGEDWIEVEATKNRLTISGLRKELKRIDLSAADKDILP